MVCTRNSTLKYLPTALQLVLSCRALLYTLLSCNEQSSSYPSRNLTHLGQRYHPSVSSINSIRTRMSSLYPNKRPTSPCGNPNFARCTKNRATLRSCVYAVGLHSVPCNIQILNKATIILPFVRSTDGQWQSWERSPCWWKETFTGIICFKPSVFVLLCRFPIGELASNRDLTKLEMTPVRRRVICLDLKEGTFTQAVVDVA